MKLHLHTVSDPLTANSVTADCGAEVVNVEVKHVWDGQEMLQGVNLPLGVCRKCLGSGKSGRYVYAVTEKK